MMKEKQPLGWASIIGYGAGDIANNFAFAMGTLFLLNYYIDVAGIPAAAVGTMLVIVRIYDAFMDLLAGRLVDLTSTSQGRFRPFLLWGALPLMLLSVAVFSVPQGWGVDAKLAYAYITYALLGTAYSLVNIPYGSLATVLTQEPYDRARLGASRTLMSVLTFCFLTMVIGPIMANKSGGELQGKLTQITSVLAVSGVFLYILCYKSTREVIGRKINQPKLKDSIKTVLGNRPLLMLCASSILIMIGYSASGASLVYFARHVVGGSSRVFFTVTGLIILFSAFFSMLVVPLLTKRFGKKNTFLAGLATACLGYLVIFFASATSQLWLYGGFCIVSAGVRIALSTMWALEADTVEYGESHTGIRSEGLNYSLFSFARKCGQSMGGSIPAFFLAASNYMPNIPVQNEWVFLSIKSTTALIPAVFMLLSLILMIFYPLTDKKYTALIEKLNA